MILTEACILSTWTPFANRPKFEERPFMHQTERPLWTKTSLNCGETLQMDTWKPNKRNDCELLWQHSSRKWLGMCILADYTHNSSTRSVLYQEKPFRGLCFQKEKQVHPNRAHLRRGKVASEEEELGVPRLRRVLGEEGNMSTAHSTHGKGKLKLTLKPQSSCKKI